VDDLKDKLAAQEVELKQKNEDADKLIKVSQNACLEKVYGRNFVICRSLQLKQRK
jgi:regulator of replication initiation timing